MNKKKTVCIGYSLTDFGADEKRDYLAKMELLELELGVYFQTFVFPSATRGAAGDIHLRYISDHLGAADFFILVCDYPGSDFDHEIYAALHDERMPTLAVAQHDKEVPDSIACKKHEKYLFARYDSIDHIVAMALEHFEMTFK